MTVSLSPQRRTAEADPSHSTFPPPHWTDPTVVFGATFSPVSYQKGTPWTDATTMTAMTNPTVLMVKTPAHSANPKSFDLMSGDCISIPYITNECLIAKRRTPSNISVWLLTPRTTIRLMKDATAISVPHTNADITTSAGLAIRK